MDCRTVDKLFDEWLDGALDAQQSDAIAGHINDCDRCNAEYGALVAALASPPEASPPDTLRDRIMDAIEQRATIAERTAPATSGTILHWRWITAAAACVGFFFAGFYAANFKSPSTQAPNVPIVKNQDPAPTQSEPQPLMSPWLAMSWSQASPMPGIAAPVVFLTRGLATELTASQATINVEHEWCPPQPLPEWPSDDTTELKYESEIPFFIPIQKSLGV